MVTQYQTDIVTRKKPMSIGDGGELMSVRAIWPSTVALGTGDFIEALVLPAEHVIAYGVLETDQLDSGATITLSVGTTSGEPGLVDSTRTVNAELLSASTVGQAGGVAVVNLAKAFRIQPAPYDRSISVKAAAGAGAAVISLTNLNVNRGTWQPSTVYTANDYIYMPNGLRAKCTTGGTSAGNPAGVWPFTNNPFYLPGNVGLYNTTFTDGSVTWTYADPCLGLTLLFAPARYGN